MLLGCVLLACKKNPLKVDISGVKEEIKVVHFDEELFAVDGSDTLKHLALLRERYSRFFDLFTQHVIKVGSWNDEYFPELMKAFLADTMIVNVKAYTDSVFADRTPLEEDLRTAFKYYRYHFPEGVLPEVFTYVSGFNQSVIVGDSLIGISLDKYLGRDCRYYKLLSTTPTYKVLNMHKDRIVPEVAYTWARARFEDPDAATNLLGHMVQLGKCMYLVDAMLPEVHDSLKIGYTGKQLEWCQNSEAAMWTYLIEHRMLYSTKRMDVVRYTRDAPTTSGFPLESPGRTGVWIGWQIVRQYMKKHPEITLPQLMANMNFQEILSDSEYNPQ